MANTLDVEPRMTYADTAIESWRILKFLLDELRPTNIENLAPEDRKCNICLEDFTSGVHTALRLPCGHTFGENCVQKWLSPHVRSAPTNPAAIVLGANTCPTCRRVVFPAQRTFDMLPLIKTRVQLWDTAYACLGIALSAEEHQARADLLQYLHSNPASARGLHVNIPTVTPGSRFPNWAFNHLLGFCDRVRAFRLTPRQELLWQALEELARRESLRVPA